MESKTASRRTEGLLTLFDMHTSFFARAIDGIPENDMYNRLNTKANHMAWLTGSLVNQRFWFVKDTHHQLKQTGEELFKDNKGIVDDAAYPTNSQYLQDWEKISPVVREIIVNVTDEKLDTEIDMGFMKMSYYNMLAFTIYREASVIGQLALWRRLLGHAALKYD